MSGVRRRGYFTAAVALIGAALLTALLTGPPDRPVDVRLVAPPPPGPETVSATATTTMTVVGPVTTTPPPAQAPVIAPVPPVPPPVKPSLTTSSSRPRGLGDLLRCDYSYFDDDLERCVPWPLKPSELCQWLDDHKLVEIEVRGRDGRGLDLDCDDF